MTRNQLLSKPVFYGALLVLGWAVAAFLYFPLINVLGEAFTRDGAVTTDTITRLANAKNVRIAVVNTLWMAGATLITVNIIGIFQVAVLEFFVVRGSGLLKIAYATPLVFMSVTAIAGYNFAYGQNGAVTKLLVTAFPDFDPRWFRGWLAVLIAHTFLMTQFHFLFLRAAIRRVDFSTVEAAQSLGAKPFTAFRRVVVPVMMPTIFAVSILVLLAALVSLAAPMILGGREFRMLNQMIITLHSIRRTDMAALLVLILGVVSLVFFLAMRWIERRGKYIGGTKTPVPMQRIRIKNPATNILVHAAAYLLFVIYSIPVLLTLAFSFATGKSIALDVIPTELTLANYEAVLFNPNNVAPLLNSIQMSALAVVFVLLLATFACHIMHKYKNVWTEILEFSLFIPFVVPASFVAIGLIIAYDQPEPLIFNNVLLGSYSILPIAYGVVIIPLMVRLISAAMVGLDGTLDDAARSLGAGPIYRFRRITLPILIPTLILVSANAFNELINEYTASVMLYNANNTPLGVAIAQGTQVYDPDRSAKTLVYATIVMSISFTIIMLADRIGLGRARSATN